MSGSTEGEGGARYECTPPWVKWLLDLQGLAEGEAVSRLFGQYDFSFFAFGSLGQALHEFADLVLAFDRGAETPYGKDDVEDPKNISAEVLKCETERKVAGSAPQPTEFPAAH